VHIRKYEGKTGITYQAIVKVKGKSDSATFPNKAAAREWGQRREVELLNEAYFPEKVYQTKTLGDAIQKYRERVLPHLAQQTIRTRTRPLEFWERNLGDTHLSNITAAMIDDYLFTLIQKGLSTNTINIYRETLSCIFNLANSPTWNMTNHNPLRFVKKRQPPPDRLPMLSLQQQEDLLHSCTMCKSPHVYVFVLFALRTGGRHNEILGAQWNQINWTQHTVRFMNTKGKIDRIVPLDSLLYKELRKWYDNREDTPYIFTNPETGLPYTKLNAVFGRVKKRLGQDFPQNLTIHDLRHVFASNCTEYMRLDVVAVANLLGHKSLAQTRRYRHLSNKHIAQQLEEFQERLERAKRREEYMNDPERAIVYIPIEEG
jgi:integrase